MRTALYMRVSTEEQAKEGYSLPSQKRKLMSYCDAHDWPIVAIYTDEGISAKNIDDRPQAKQLLEDAKNGLFENILILKVDRLARNTRNLLEIVDLLKKHKVHLNAVEETIDYETPTGKMMLTILGSFAELERSTITARTNAGKEQKRLSGYKVAGGFIPYGYEFKEGQFVAIPDQAEIIQKIYKMYLDGMTGNEICIKLQSDHIPSPKNGKTWERSTLMRILKNETYIGYIRGIPAKNIDPILSEESFFMVQNLINSRSSTKARKYAKDDFLFADVAYCGVCGRKLVCKQEAKPRCRKYYMCYYNSSKHLHSGDEGAHSARMENSTLEELFLDYFNNFKLDLANTEIKADEERLKQLDRIINSLENKKSTLQKRKSRSLEKYMDGLIDDSEYAEISSLTSKSITDLESEIQTYQDEKDQISSGPNNKDFAKHILEARNTLADFWELMDTHQKRLFITSTIKKIQIVRGRITLIEFR